MYSISVIRTRIKKQWTKNEEGKNEKEKKNSLPKKKPLRYALNCHKSLWIFD